MAQLCGCTRSKHLMTVAPDPSSSALTGAVDWLQGALLGSAATAAAVTAVGWVGLLMLSGRVDIRRGGTVMLGCFILFGASSIARGILTAVQSGAAPAGVIAAAPPPPNYPPSPPPKAQAAYDPYAGAAVGAAK